MMENLVNFVIHFVDQLHTNCLGIQDLSLGRNHRLKVWCLEWGKGFGSNCFAKIDRVSLLRKLNQTLDIIFLFILKYQLNIIVNEF